jgi:5-keto 4-deoxyuronate isomerase
LANHKSSLNIPTKWRKLGIIYFLLDTKISEESVFKQVYSSTCSTKELSISMTRLECGRLWVRAPVGSNQGQ